MEYSYLSENLQKLQDSIAKACIDAGREPESVNLIAVTKTCPPELLKELLNLGIKDLGENRPQEIMAKAPLLSLEPRFHLIGQLQTNKVKKILPLVHSIHSVDREKLLCKIDEEAKKIERRVPIFIQVNCSGEESKSGVLPQDAEDLCRKASELSGVELVGLMTIGPLVGGESETRESFKKLRAISQELDQNLFSGGKPKLSMGMSGDFPIAIAEGATHIRVGSLLTGPRG